MQCIVNQGDLIGNVRNGAVIQFNGELFMVVEARYIDENGEGVLIEPYTNSKIIDLTWERVRKKWSNIVQTPKGDKYELMNTLAVWYTPKLHQVVGIILRDRETGQTKGYTFVEAWDLVMKHGGSNIAAGGEHHGSITTRLLTTKNNLPCLDDPSWAIPALTERDQPHATYTERLKRDISRKINSTISPRFMSIWRKKRLEGRMGKKVIVNPEQLIKYNELANLIKRAGKIVVLSGAGISTESLIPDFRSSQESIWMKDSQLLEKMNHYYLATNQEGFWHAFKQLMYLVLDDLLPIKTKQTLLKVLGNFEPNSGHKFFAELEQQGKEVVIITQNVDGLHSKAGSSKVIEIHGNINNVVCPDCGKRYDIDFALQQDVPRCTNTSGNKLCRAILRPDVVLFGDAVKGFDEAFEHLSNADLLIVIGTSLEVAPANQLPMMSDNRNVKKVFINKETTRNDDLFDLVICGEIGDIVSGVKGVLC